MRPRKYQTEEERREAQRVQEEEYERKNKAGRSRKVGRPRKYSAEEDAVRDRERLRKTRAGRRLKYFTEEERREANRIQAQKYRMLKRAQKLAIESSQDLDLNSTKSTSRRRVGEKVVGEQDEEQVEERVEEHVEELVEEQVEERTKEQVEEGVKEQANKQAKQRQIHREESKSNLLEVITDHEGGELVRIGKMLVQLGSRGDSEVGERGRIE